jgi:hypothetical protein
MSAGIEVSHEAVRYWSRRFGPMFAAEIRARRREGLRSVSRWRWHLDEVFVRVNGVQHYLWRAVDHEGEVLRLRDQDGGQGGALKFLQKLMKRHGRARGRHRQAALLRRSPQGDGKAMTGGSRSAGRTTARRTHTNPSDDASGPCCAQAHALACRSSPRSTDQSTTTSTPSAAFLPTHLQAGPRRRSGRVAGALRWLTSRAPAHTETSSPSSDSIRNGVDGC